MSGSLAPGANEVITLTADATGMMDGFETTDFDINSNALTEPSITVPVEFDIADVAPNDMTLNWNCIAANMDASGFPEIVIQFDLTDESHVPAIDFIEYAIFDAANFTITEDGVAQPITLVERPYPAPFENVYQVTYMTSNTMADGTNRDVELTVDYTDAVTGNFTDSGTCDYDAPGSMTMNIDIADDPSGHEGTIVEVPIHVYNFEDVEVGGYQFFVQYPWSDVVDDFTLTTGGLEYAGFLVDGGAGEPLRTPEEVNSGVFFDGTRDIGFINFNWADPGGGGGSGPIPGDYGDPADNPSYTIITLLFEINVEEPGPTDPDVIVPIRWEDNEPLDPDLTPPNEVADGDGIIVNDVNYLDHIYYGGGRVTVTNARIVSGEVIYGLDGFRGVENVTMELNPTSNLSAVTASDVTDAAGEFELPTVTQADYRLRGVPNETDPTNTDGLNGADLIAMQRHISGDADFVSPFQHIAADVNDMGSGLGEGDGNVSIADVVLFERFILGFAGSEFTYDQGNWRFIPQYYPINMMNWASAPFYAIGGDLDPLESSEVIDFYGVRLGDVNNTWTGPISADEGSAEDELDSGRFIAFENVEASFDSDVSMPIYAGTDLNDIGLFELFFTYPDSLVEYVGFTTPHMDEPLVNDEEPGTVKMLWTDINSSFDVDAGDEVGRLHFRTLEALGNAEIAVQRAAAYDLETDEYLVGLEDGMIDIDVATGIGYDSNVMVTEYKLHPAFPNPFNPTATLTFDVKETSQVRIVVYNVLGGVVGELVNQQLPNGRFNVTIDASDWASGSYFVRMQAGSYSDVQKVVLLR